MRLFLFELGKVTENRTKMIKIVSTSKSKDKVQLGDICEYEVIQQKPDVEIRYFLKQHGILYLKPLSDWMIQPKIRFFPEAPGKYGLIVQWREPDGSNGWIEHPFEVTVNAPLSSAPQLVEIDRATHIWVPSQWEANLLRGYEQATFGLLSKIIKPGWIAYDVGANLGLYSIYFSRAVGNRGHVYCFEANPLCVYFLKANLEQNRLTNYDILPVALLDRFQTSDFTINYGNCGIGLTQKSSFYVSKAGHEIVVQSDSLDTLIANYNLKKPNLIKIDIEGAEEFAVSGMELTLSRDRPVLLLEIHGRPAAEKTFQKLEGANYRYQDAASRKEFANVAELLAWFPNTVLQIIGFPK